MSGLMCEVFMCICGWTSVRVNPSVRGKMYVRMLDTCAGVSTRVFVCRTGGSECGFSVWVLVGVWRPRSACLYHHVCVYA